MDANGNLSWNPAYKKESANEVDQVSLLERDVLIQFLQIRQLQHENEQLKKKLNKIKELL
jgi:hypothetical protein